MAMTAYYRKTYYVSLSLPPFSCALSPWLCLLFILHSLLAVTLSYSLYLSLHHCLLSLLPARFSSDRSLAYWGKQHRANDNSQFLSESCWVRVSKRYEDTNQEMHNKSRGVFLILCWAVTTVRVVYIWSKVRREGKTMEGGRTGGVR